MEVMRTVLRPELDDVAATDGGTSSVAISKGEELDAAKDRGLSVDVEAAVEAIEIGNESAEIPTADLVVATSVSGLLPGSFCGQPDELHGSTEQQPWKPFDLHL